MKILTDDDILQNRNNKIKSFFIYFSVGFFILISLLLFVKFKPNVITNINVNTGFTTDNANSGTLNNIENTGSILLDKNWGVATNEIDRIISDPEVVKNPEKLKLELDKLNKKTNGL